LIAKSEDRPVVAINCKLKRCRLRQRNHRGLLYVG
jgi:hypothetical protein